MKADSPFDELEPLLKTTALSNDHLTEIGRITANFAILEHELKILIQKLLKKNDNISRAVTSELSFRSILSLASTLVTETMGKTKKDTFLALIPLITNAESKRNQIIHSLWGSYSKKVAIRTKYTAKIKSGLKFQRQEITVDDLIKIASEISLVAYRVYVFSNQI